VEQCLKSIHRHRVIVPIVVNGSFIRVINTDNVRRGSLAYVLPTNRALMEEG